MLPNSRERNRISKRPTMLAVKTSFFKFIVISNGDVTWTNMNPFQANV